MKKRIALVTWRSSYLFPVRRGQYRHNRSRWNSISNNKKATGSSSHDLLSGDIYKSMVIELVLSKDLNHQLQQLIIYFFFECQNQ
jgi:hypothetical protein